MLPLILFAVAAMQQISVECANTIGAHAGVQTQPVLGPAGSSAVLRVSSSDDGSKDSHQCMADYQLLITPAAGAAPETMDFLSSDGDYGRGITVRLDGFSQDGKQVVGVLTEGGEAPMTLLFDYHASAGPVQLVDLAKQFAHLMPKACSRTLGVIGTTPAAALVLETNSANLCASPSRWLLDPSAAKARPLRQSDTFQSLYNVR